MKRIALIIFFLFSYSSSQANEKICGWIMDEPFKEYQKESKDINKINPDQQVDLIEYLIKIIENKINQL